MGEALFVVSLDWDGTVVDRKTNLQFGTLNGLRKHGPAYNPRDIFVDDLEDDLGHVFTRARKLGTKLYSTISTLGILDKLATALEGYEDLMPEGPSIGEDHWNPGVIRGVD